MGVQLFSWLGHAGAYIEVTGKDFNTRHSIHAFEKLVWDFFYITWLSLKAHVKQKEREKIEILASEKI